MPGDERPVELAKAKAREAIKHRDAARTARAELRRVIALRDAEAEKQVTRCPEYLRALAGMANQVGGQTSQGLLSWATLGYRSKPRLFQIRPI